MGKTCWNILEEVLQKHEESKNEVQRIDIFQTGRGEKHTVFQVTLINIQAKSEDVEEKKIKENKQTERHNMKTELLF